MPAFRSVTLYCISAALLCLSACAPFSKWPDLGKSETVSFTIDEAAVILPAHYDKNYLLEGNIVARYQDFDFVRLSSETVAIGHSTKLPGTYSIFEVRERQGVGIKRLLLSPKNQKQLLRFTVHGKSYFIQEGAKDGSFTISIPSQFIASHHVSTH